MKNILLSPKSKRDYIISILIFTFIMSLVRFTRDEDLGRLSGETSNYSVYLPLPNFPQYCNILIETFGTFLGFIFLFLTFLLLLSLVSCIILSVRYLINRKSPFLETLHNWSFYFMGFIILGDFLNEFIASLFGPY